MNSGLLKTLTLPDLILFGITCILGSGGFNLVGNAIKEGGHYFPLTLLLSGALFGGSTYSYAYANDTYKKNISETLLIESVFGETGKYISALSILIYNVFAIATILVFSSKMLFPKGSYIGQVSFSIMILTLMTLCSFQKLEINKEIINIFSYIIIALLGLHLLLGLEDW